ncbi:MAG: M20/M25/M40 family metallo-hydrolase, partial [Myxococcales bacterium]
MSQSYDPADGVVDLCRDLIRIDTSNFGDDTGPGERKAAEYVASFLTDCGIEPTVVESEPGRASVLARWGGTEGTPILLHGHLDVVPAMAEDWSSDPFAAEIVDGQIVGRGAVDMKDFDAMLLATIKARTDAGAVPDRPFVLCFTADEEAGGMLGAGHLVEHHRGLAAFEPVAVGELGGFST